MSDSAHYDWLPPWIAESAEPFETVGRIQARLRGGALPLQLSLGLFPADLSDYQQGLAALPEREQALVIAAVETSLELRPEHLAEAAVLVAGLVARGTQHRGAELLAAVEPLLCRHGSAPATVRPADPVLRRRLDVLSHLRSAVVPDDTQTWPERTRTMSAAPRDEPLAHPEVWGQFRDLRPVAAGGFGVVYRAWDQQLHREVALKLLRPGQGEHSGEAAILQEARMMARVKHPHIVPVYGVDSHDGRVGLWSEWVEGVTLAALVKTSGPVDPYEGACMLIQLCEAVSALHGAGILHRDIKAGNAIRERSSSGGAGRVLLMDFGLSQDPGIAASLAGTPRYTAPELLAGGKLSVASDIYALGVLLYFLVAGRFPADPGEQGPAKQEPVKDAPPVFPGSLGAIINRATAPWPEARFNSAEGMRQALAAFVDSRPKATARRMSRIAVAGLAALVLLSLAAYGVYRGNTHTVPGGAYTTYQQAHQLLLRRDKPGNLSKAVELFQQTLRTDPRFALAQAELADAYWEQFRLTKEIPLKDKALASANRALELDRELAPIYVTLGRIHNGTGQSSIAMQDFRRALELDSRNADVYRELAEIYQAQGRNADAEASWQKAIDLNPADWRNFNNRGVYLFNAGKLHDAELQFNHALDAAPDNVMVLNNIGRVHVLQGQYDAARTIFRKVVRLSPNDPVNYRALGTLCLTTREFDRAADAFARAAELAPADYLNWANLGVAFQFTSGGMKKARPAYLKAIELALQARRENPADAFLLADLATYRAALGDRRESLTLLRQAIAMSPEDTDVMVRVGEGYEILGFRDKALPLLREALRRGYTIEMLRRSPELANLLDDPASGLAPLPIRTKK